MDDLKGFKVPVLILSGGEPLLRPDIYDIAKRAKAKGFYVGLSSNGTLIDENNIAKIAECDFNYVGVSLDGHSRDARQVPPLDGAFEASLKGHPPVPRSGLKIGVRFTMTQDNAHDLPGLLKLVEDEGIDRFYFSHLNYAGRGNKNRKDDAQHQLTRWAMDLLFDTCWDYQQRGLELKRIHHRQQRCRRRLFPALGASRFPDSGGACRGQAAPVGRQFVRRQCRQHRQPRQRASRHHVVASTLGNVKDRPFSQIWPDTSDALMAGLKRHPRRSKGAAPPAPICHLQRQHARPRPAADRQPVG